MLPGSDTRKAVELAGTRDSSCFGDVARKGVEALTWVVGLHCCCLASVKCDVAGAHSLAKPLVAWARHSLVKADEHFGVWLQLSIDIEYASTLLFLIGHFSIVAPSDFDGDFAISAKVPSKMVKDYNSEKASS